MTQASAHERLLILAIFVVALALRLIALSIPTNVDEGLWMRRGPSFFASLQQGDLANTYLRHHPGVPTMWLIGGSMALRCALREQSPTTLALDQTPSLSACLHLLARQTFFPIEFYATARALQAVITAACLAALYALGRRLFDPALALGAVALLSFEPFFLAYQRFLTTDALQTDFGALASLALLLHLRADRGRRWLIASGVALGLATASKAPALFVLPAVAVWIVLIERGRWQPDFAPRGWRRQCVDLALWGASALATLWLIWPTLWVAPLPTATRFFADIQTEAAGHAQFFLGQPTNAPGPLFYPLVLAYRLSPVLQIGLLVALGQLVIARLRHALTHAPALAALALNALAPLLLFSLSASKIDRYIVAVIPALAFLAAAGWRALLPALVSRMRGRLEQHPRAPDAISRLSGFFAAGEAGREDGRRAPGWPLALALVQFLFLLPCAPYYVAYYNPLLGGTRVAQRLLMIGNGEGLDRVAAWLNQQPNADALTVASWHPAGFAPYFRGRVIDVRKIYSLDLWPWTKAQRVVLYVNQFQRQLPDPQILAYFAAQQPLYVVRLHGVEYAHVYPGPLPLPEEIARVTTPLNWTLSDNGADDSGDAVRLHGIEVAQTQVAVGQEVVVAFYWEITGQPPPDSTIYLGLHDALGNRWGGSDQRPLEGYEPLERMEKGARLRDVHRLTVLPGTPPGTYQVKVSWFSPSEGHALDVRDAAGAPLGNQPTVAEVQVLRASRPPDPSALAIDHPTNMDVGPLRLLGYVQPTEEALAGSTLPLTLLWQRRQAGPAPFTLALELRQGAQAWRRQAMRPLSPAYPPEQWETGEVVREQWPALLPSQAPAGRYELALVIGQGAGQPEIVAPLGAITIRVRPHRVDLPQPQFPRDVTWSDPTHQPVVRLLGYDRQLARAATVSAATVPPGGTLALTLYWQALAEMDTAYKVFIHFVDENGQIRAQEDHPPLNGDAPTTSWLPGEVLEDPYHISLPADLPPGRYSLRAGLYDPVTGRRLAVIEGHGAADSIELFQIEMTP